MTSAIMISKAETSPEMPVKVVPSVAERVAVKTAMEIRLALTVMEMQFALHVISPVNAVPVMAPEVGNVPLVKVSRGAISVMPRVPARIAAEMVYVIIVTEACYWHVQIVMAVGIVSAVMEMATWNTSQEHAVHVTATVIV